MPYTPPAGSGGGDGGPSVDQVARDAASNALSAASDAQTNASDAKSTAEDAKTAATTATGTASAAQSAALGKFTLPPDGIDSSLLATTVQALLALASSSVQAADLASLTPQTRTITPGTGLTGGGSLAANRTLSLTAATIASLAKADSAVQHGNADILIADLAPVIQASLSNANTASQPGHTHTAAQITDGASVWASVSRTITPGTGLTGGGSLAADRSIALSAGTVTSLGRADTAVQPAGLTTALSTKADISALTSGLAGKADLVNGFVPTSQLPAIALDNISVVASEAEMLALVAQNGDVAKRTDLSGQTFMLGGDGNPATLANWISIGGVSSGGGIQSVNGQTSPTVVLGKADIGLGSVDNTADADKPISSATATALSGKAATSHTHPASQISDAGTTGRVLVQAATAAVAKTALSLDLVSNTADADKPISTATASALALKAPLASPTFTGTVSGITATMVGLGNVTNTSDANKPVSTAQASAIALKAPIASPTFTGTVGGITAAMVGLGNVTNTSDANKPVSTAQQTALNAKVGTDGTVLQVISLTQAAYTALGTKSATTLYVING